MSCTGLGRATGNITGRRIAEQQSQQRNHDGKGNAENHHGFLQAGNSEHIVGQGSDINRSQTEAGNYDTCNQTCFSGREPLERRRRRSGVAETDSHAGQDTKTEDPCPVIGGLGNQHEADTDHQAADNCGDAGTESILKLAGDDHRKREHQAADGVGVVDRRHVPVKGSGASSLDRFGDCTLENTPGIENTEGQVDTGTRQNDGPSACVGSLICVHGVVLLRQCGVERTMTCHITNLEGQRPLALEGLDHRARRPTAMAACRDDLIGRRCSRVSFMQNVFALLFHPSLRC